jgi:molybdopterin-guanine dinucleotide biosynthesis protein B
MKIFAITGYSDSGKTRLIRQLITELKRRGYSVAVIKHCAHGFALDTEGKDSWKYIEAGSDAVSMLSPERMAVLIKNTSELTLKTIASQYLKNIDIILVEGGREDRNLKKIEVLRKGVSEKVEAPLEEIIAVVSDFEVTVDKPVYNPDQVKEIADFLEEYVEPRKPRVILDIDGVSISMNTFVQRIFENTLLGMITSLEGIKKNPESITLSLMRKEGKSEKA